MNRRRRVAVGLAIAAAVLLIGRGLAVAYTDLAWYRALGALPLWRERAYDVISLHSLSFVCAGLFAFANLSAIRRSIVSLAFPRRMGNVEFGEAVPGRYLDRAVLIVSLAIAGAMAFVVPPWQQLALVRAAPQFGERDPFYQNDLGFYVAWLPFESRAYAWTLTLLLLVSVVVISLYALTPSLRWQGGAFRVSVYVRRHLAALASLLLVLMAWSYRLDGFQLLTHGSGPDGMFSYVDHQWLIPAYLSLSVGVVAAAALVLASGWTGQLRLSFFTISGVLIFSVALDLVLPSVVRRMASRGELGSRERPYQATREAFTRRAYSPAPAKGETLAPPGEVARFAAFADSGRIRALVAASRPTLLVYPGARGAAIAMKARNVAAPELGSGLERLAHAWAERRIDLAWGSLPADARIVSNRDVRSRAAALAPVFVQGSTVPAMFFADTLVWIVELYSASNRYPLSRHYKVGDRDWSYFRHAGTMLINSRTAGVFIVPPVSPDPIAADWRKHFPELFRAGSRDVLDVLTPTPSIAAIEPSGPRSSADSSFRKDVTRLYDRMRAALTSGDLKAFAAAWDTLGTVIGR
jgi:uncharacterized membrane protein (UPF0182 family)